MRYPNARYYVTITIRQGVVKGDRYYQFLGHAILSFSDKRMLKIFFTVVYQGHISLIGSDDRLLTFFVSFTTG